VPWLRGYDDGLDKVKEEEEEEEEVHVSLEVMLALLSYSGPVPYPLQSCVRHRSPPLNNALAEEVHLAVLQASKHADSEGVCSAQNIIGLGGNLSRYPPHPPIKNRSIWHSQAPSPTTNTHRHRHTWPTTPQQHHHRYHHHHLTMPPPMKTTAPYPCCLRSRLENTPRSLSLPPPTKTRKVI